MARFATGKYAYGISDRSGFRYRLKDMRREWNGLLVGPDEYEPKHPQLRPVRISPDAEALRDPRPDTNNIIPVEVSFPVFDLTTLRFIPNPSIVGKIGSVSVSTTSTGSVSVSPTGVSGTGAIGSVTLTTASTFDSTGVTLDSSNKTFDEG